MMIVSSWPYNGYLRVKLIALLGVQIWWSSNTLLVTEGENVTISLLLDREPGIQFTVLINVTDIDTTS